MPLVNGKYPNTNALWKLTGGLANVNQSNIPARSNLEWLGAGTIVDGAIATTGVSTSVAVPVEVGDVITKISVLVGATAEGTGTHAFTALYSGIAVPAKLAQSADDTGAASYAASAMYTQTLSSPQRITAAIAPNGFIYATVCVTAGTIPTLASVATAAAVWYQWTTTAPLFVAATHGSGQGATAAATIVTPSAFARAPVVFLT